jgi:sulfide dehydrogenase cytochrome subunit
MITRPLHALVLLVSCTIIACQTTSSAPSSATPSAAGRAETRTSEPVKSISAEAAQTIAANCFTCHGPNGRSPGTIPSLANLSAGDIAVRVKNFKNGTAVSTVMGRHAKAYSDAEIDAVAAYIAGLKKPGAP